MADSGAGMIMGMMLGVVVGVMFKDQLSGLLGGLGGPAAPANGATEPAGTCEYVSAPMESDPNQFRINDAAGKEAGAGVYYKSKAEADAKIAEMCASTTPPTDQPDENEGKKGGEEDEDEDKDKDEDEDDDKSDYARAYFTKLRRLQNIQVVPYEDYY